MGYCTISFQHSLSSVSKMNEPNVIEYLRLHTSPEVEVSHFRLTQGVRVGGASRAKRRGHW